MGWQSRLGRARRHVIGSGPVPPLGDNAHLPAASGRALWATWLVERKKVATRQSREARERNAS